MEYSEYSNMKNIMSLTSLSSQLVAYTRMERDDGDAV